MATFSALVTVMAQEMRDTGNIVFSTTMLGRYLNKALHEIGRVAPEQFIEELEVETDLLEYELTHESEWTEVARVEAWDVSVTPNEFVALLRPLSTEYDYQTPTGWFLWTNKLYITPAQAHALIDDTHILKVWGWGPYADKSGSDEMPTGVKENVLIEGARVQALKSLLTSRNMYTQWQALGSNHDASPAALTAQLANAQDEFRRLIKQITVPRGGL